MAGELDAELWSTLPTELMDLVLQRLPISSLCKFRAVCKHWSTLPTLRAEDPYILCFPDGDLELEFRHVHRCKLYSFPRNQWEDLDLSFLAPLVAQHCLGQDSYGTIRLMNSCSDGGLLSLNGQISKKPRYWSEGVEEAFLLVCNPLTRTTKFLPSLNSSTEYITNYVMHRDPSSGVYKIFAVVVYHHVQLHYYMYDSNLESWKRILTLRRDNVMWVNLLSCSVVCNGVYYCVCGEDEHGYEFSAYNINEEKWLAAGVKTKLDSYIRSVSFVVRKDCLFLLARTRRNKTRFYRIDDSKEMKLLRLDGSEEIKLPKKLDWYKAFEYGDFILFLTAVDTEFTVVNISDPVVVMTRFVPLFPIRFSAYFPIYERATFNLHATL